MAESDRATRGGRASPVAFVRRTWFAEAGQLASIRSEVRRWLESLGMIEDAAGDVVFAVSEAASNAVEHAYRRAAADAIVELTFWTEGAAICIEIVDHGRWRQPLSSELSGRGRGIPIMRELMDSVLISYDGRGTRVLLRHLLPVRPEL
jgi:serine/threonine-protein kinase RsbW